MLFLALCPFFSQDCPHWHFWDPLHTYPQSLSSPLPTHDHPLGMAQMTLWMGTPLGSVLLCRRLQKAAEAKWGRMQDSVDWEVCPELDNRWIARWVYWNMEARRGFSSLDLKAVQIVKATSRYYINISFMSIIGYLLFITQPF